MGAHDLSAFLWPEVGQGRLPSELKLRPEYFQDSALCFVFDSTEPKNLARNNFGKKLTRVAAALKLRSAGVGVGCSSTTRSYMDSDWVKPIATDTYTGAGAFSILIRATLASSATRGFPLHIRYNDLPYNSVFVQQNGYYADGGSSSVNESGSVWIGTYASTPGAQGLKVAGLLSTNPKDCTFLFNRFADGTQELWLNGKLVASNTVASPNQVHNSGAVQLLSIGGNASSTGFPATDPVQLIYVANKTFGPSESAELSANSSLLFAPESIPFVELTSAGTTALTATGISTGSPVLGSPGLGQKHALSATGITTGTAVLGSPEVGQKHALTASGLSTQSPVLGDPSLAEIASGTLVANGIATGAPVLGHPSIAQIHVLTASGITLSSPVLGHPLLSSTTPATDSEKIALILSILSNKQTLDPTTGVFTLYADDGETVLKTAQAWEDAAGTVPYRGQGLKRIDALQ